MENDIILERKANHFRDQYYADGGKIYLTKHSLKFIPHKFNLPKGEFEVRLDDIKKIYKMDIAGFSKQIWIDLKEGDTEKFVMWKRDEFIQEVTKLLSNGENN